MTQYFKKFSSFFNSKYNSWHIEINHITQKWKTRYASPENLWGIPGSIWNHKRPFSVHSKNNHSERRNLQVVLRESNPSASHYPESESLKHRICITERGTKLKKSLELVQSWFQFHTRIWLQHSTIEHPRLTPNLRSIELSRAHQILKFLQIASNARVRNYTQHKIDRNGTEFSDDRDFNFRCRIGTIF